MSKIDIDNLEVVHDAGEHRFYMEFKEGDAYLSYRRDRDIVDYHYTYVPPVLRNMGIAEKITWHAMNWARDNNLEVKPSCPYVAAFASRHPEFASVVK